MIKSMVVDTEKLEKLLREISRKYSIPCRVDADELLVYLNAESYEEDTTSIDEILGNELLLFHELVEICILKSMGYRITPFIFKEAYPDSYKAHIEAMREELEKAKINGEVEWINRRCIDLKSYLDDPLLPRDMTPVITSIIKEYCSGQ